MLPLIIALPLESYKIISYTTANIIVFSSYGVIFALIMVACAVEFVWSYYCETLKKITDNNDITEITPLDGYAIIQ